jgi:hypothetical protein
MADLAVVFGWAPRDMDHMTLPELAGWWHRARARSPAGRDDDD